MAYLNVSNRYKEVIYSGDAKTKPILKINNIVVNNLDTLPENNKIKSINKIHNIIKIGDNRLSLDNFVAQELEIQIYDFDYSTYHDSTLAYDVIDLSLSTLVDDVWETVPIGIFNIIGTPSSDKNLTIIKANCNRVKFDIPYNAQPLIEQYGGEVEIGILLQNICTICGVELGTSLPFINSTTKIGVYDSTINANIYVSYICEKAGSIAVSGRDGKLYLIPINNNLYKHLIDFNKVKGQNTQNYGDKFVYDRVVYEDGIRKLANPVNATNNITIYINANNPYILEQQEIDNIYDSINGFNIENLKFEIYGDPTIDAWDLVSFTKDEIEHKTLANNTLKYNGILMQTFDTNIGTQKTVQENVTIKNEDVAIKKLKVEQDQLNGTLTSVVSQTNSLNENFSSFKNEVIQTINETTNEITKTGGLNIIKNSQMYQDLENWTKSDDLAYTLLLSNTEVEKNTVSGTEIIITNGTLSQELSTIVGKQYTFSALFKIKNITTSSIDKISIRMYRNENDYITLYDYILTNEITNRILISKSHTATVSNPTLKIVTNGGVEVGLSDLIVQSGTSTEWSPNPNEVNGFGHSIRDDKLKLYDLSASGKSTKLDSDDLTFYQNNNIKSFYSSNNFENENGNITNKLKIGGLSIKKIDDNNTIFY